MPHAYIHYFVDSVNGLAKIHFSASQFKAKVHIKNKTIFTCCLAGMQQIPSGDKIWNPDTKTWNVHSLVWITLMPYYTVAPEIYGMVTYATRAQWEGFITGKVNYDPSQVYADGFTRSAVTDAEKAAQFFGTAAFNSAVYATAIVNNDREELLSLLGLNSWGQLDTILSDKNGAAKKLYRSAAIKYHPDKNNGDGSKMSKLNELWGIYGTR